MGVERAALRGNKAHWVACTAGNGSQWAGMARELMEENKSFRDRIWSCTQVLKEKYGFDVFPQFTAENGWDDPVSASVGLTAIQIAMVDLLAKSYGVMPAGVFGHSAGTFLVAVISPVLVVLCWYLRD